MNERIRRITWRSVDAEAAHVEHVAAAAAAAAARVEDDVEGDVVENDDAAEREISPRAARAVALCDRLLHTLPHWRTKQREVVADVRAWVQAYDHVTTKQLDMLLRMAARVGLAETPTVSDISEGTQHIYVVGDKDATRVRAACDSVTQLVGSRAEVVILDLLAQPEMRRCIGCVVIERPDGGLTRHDCDIATRFLVVQKPIWVVRPNLREIVRAAGLAPPSTLGARRGSVARVVVMTVLSDEGGTTT